MNDSHILQSRAQILARAEVSEEERARLRAGQLKIIEFRLAHETYGVEASMVREVYPLKDLTTLPCTPAFIAGIVNIRGQIMAVIDLKIFFELPRKGLTELNKVLIVRSPQMEVGILADEIIGVNFVAPDELQTSLPTLTGLRAEYLRGITTERVIVLDAGRLLGDEKLLVNEDVR